MLPITETTGSTPPPQPQSQRRYDLDWLRVIAIITLLFYHTGMIYVSWGWHIKSSEHSQPMEEIMRWLHRWRMPLLFFISGAGSFFALKRRTFGQYAGERIQRLFVPLVFGMFMIVPPQIYIEWLFKGRFTGSYADFYPYVLQFQPYHDGGTGGAFSWHHLWFVCYLFFYSLLSIPVFRWLKSDGSQRFTDWFGRLITRPGGALWVMVVVICLSQYILRPFYPDETHGLTNDWAYFVENLLLFWFGYVLVSRREFWTILADQRRIFLVATIIFTAVLYGIRAQFSDDEIDRRLWLDLLYGTNSMCLMIASVLATITYGYRYLNVSRPILPRLNEAVYPFYILHQTAIVLIGYWVITRLNLGVYPGFLFISLSSGLVCIVLILFVIRPFKLIRILFGMKSK